MNEPISLFAFFGRIRKGAIAKFSSDAVPNKPAKQYGPAMTGLTAIAKLAGLWVDQTANINGNYAISDKPLTRLRLNSAARHHS